MEEKEIKDVDIIIALNDIIKAQTKAIETLRYKLAVKQEIIEDLDAEIKELKKTLKVL